MHNLQRAVNFETLVKALRCSDSRAIPIYEKLKSISDVDKPLIYDVSFCRQFAEYDLFGSYDQVMKSFDSIVSDVVIIDKDDGCWPEDVKGFEFLYLRGNKNLLKKKGLSIVGTRSPSEAGQRRARDITDEVGRKYVIVSGLARGIDSACHLQALNRGYDTIAVIGTNICEYYPPENRQLQDLIAENGLLVSPFAPCRKTEKYFFVARNRVMSQISCASFVVQSSDNGGGVKQAKFTEQQGKPVFVLREDFDDSQISWPHVFTNPIVVDSGLDVIPYLNGTKKLNEVQPSLFQLI